LQGACCASHLAVPRGVFVGADRPVRCLSPLLAPVALDPHSLETNTIRHGQCTTRVPREIEFDATEAMVRLLVPVCQKSMQRLAFTLAIP
jgi:hypothetical protein